MNSKSILTSFLSLVIILLACNLFFNACQQEENLSQTNHPDEVFFSKFRINKEVTQVNNYNELNLKIESMLNDGTRILTTELRKSEDGTFYYLYSKGQKDDLSSTIGIPLDWDGTMLSAEAGCSHRCDQSSFNPCSTCDLTIHEKCKRQSCTCKSATGGCDGAIVFPD